MPALRLATLGACLGCVADMGAQPAAEGPVTLDGVSYRCEAGVLWVGTPDEASRPYAAERCPSDEELRSAHRWVHEGRSRALVGQALTRDHCSYSPDSWRGVEFGSCCARHDDCYNCGGDWDRRRACDQEMRQCMLEVGAPAWLAGVYYGVLRRVSAVAFCHHEDPQPLAGCDLCPD